MKIAGTPIGTSASQTPTTVWSANMFASKRTASVRMRARSSGISSSRKTGISSRKCTCRPKISRSKKLGPMNLTR